MTTASIQPESAAPPVVTLHGIDFHVLTEDQTNQRIIQAIAVGRGGWVVTANLDHLHRLKTDPSYKQLCQPADLVVADGMPLVWASRIQGTPLPQRVAGSAMVTSLAVLAGQHRRSIFFLGGEPGVAEQAAEKLKNDCPGLVVAGTYCPPMGFENDPAQMQQIEQRLAESKPDIVYVALGSPKQERLITQLRPLLPAAWWIGVGISFSYIAGHVTRAPAWMRKTGLEWIFRLLQEPKRLFRRYLIVGIPYALRLLTTAFLSRFRSQRGG